MSNPQTPYISTPPIDDEVLTKDNKLTDIWKNHFDSISENIGYVVGHDRLNNAIKQETPVITVITMTEANRDLLQNARNGTIIYNTDTHKFNFRENGAWVTL